MAELKAVFPAERRIAENRGIKSFVLRTGRMSAAQKRCYGEFFPRFCLAFNTAEGGHFGAPLDLAGIFGNGNPVIAEIGFGMGIATALIAERNPGKNYLGIEVHRPGIGRLLWEIDRRGLANIRIVEGDAAEVMRVLVPDRSLAGIHIFFPDPWPKKRHHKRRLITFPFTALLARKLALSETSFRGAPSVPAGYVYAVTDWEDYAYWILRELSGTAGLKNAYDGFAERQDWRPETKFERKGKEKKHKVWELFFEACETGDHYGQ
ncbi:MAG: tRNA (guanosine(46)-N7)-methyltransferase TrmB [Spirochaetaceae bacterium]|jgi:tRNA (guanine-N7-)-methyltransferase|nr:tRNA (guanosine(46)-N7)-methyltransferase TrmB [Spirochaetaceae bacterium]